MSFGDEPKLLDLVECRTTPRKGKWGIVFGIKRRTALVWWFSGIPNDLTKVNWYDIRAKRT
jgi:hypothetical protein